MRIPCRLRYRQGTVLTCIWGFILEVNEWCLQVLHPEACKDRQQGQEASICSADRVRKPPVCFSPTAHGLCILNELKHACCWTKYFWDELIVPWPVISC